MILEKNDGTIEFEMKYGAIPIEIKHFYRDVFEVYETRERVGEFRGIKFYVYGNDHYPPHVHAIYGEYSVSIFLSDYKVEGNIPIKNKKIACKWVKEHIDMLNTKWRNKSIISSTNETRTFLDSK